MHLLRSEEMRRADRAAMKEYGISGLVLMENAGAALARQACIMLNDKPQGKRVLVFAGTGNNGGDGLVAARHLYNAGADVRIFLFGDATSLSGDSAVNWQIVEKMEIKRQSILAEEDANVLKVALLSSQLIIDALYGTGFHGAIRGGAALAVRLMNESGQPVLAADIPSGVLADTGKVEGVAVRASQTLTFGAAKPGLFLMPGADYAGKITVADISLPQKLLRQQDADWQYLDQTFAMSLLPKRSLDTHKGDYGHVLIIGGSRRMPGAPILAARGAMAVGAGLVTVAAPQETLNALTVALPEAMGLPLPTDADGNITAAAAEKVLAFAEKKTIVLGMGLGKAATTREFVYQLLPKVPQAAVVDADALTALSKGAKPTEDWKKTLIFTPHPGEMAQLMGSEAKKVQENRLSMVEEAARIYRGIVLLKGYRTLISDGAKRLYINGSGNPGMSVGGSGDVLSGIIGGLLAQGLPPMAAAGLGAWLHGAAGDKAAAALGEASMTALDIVKYFPFLWQEIAQGE